MALIILLSLYISLFDLRHHRITNLSIVLISILLLIEGDFHFYFRTGIFFLCVLLIAAIIGGLGAGDVKLLVAVALVAIPLESMNIFLTFLVMAVLILAALTIAARMRIRGNIALAPAICASYLALLLSG
jgi:Flp pilus assembly protein protease CpaA